MKVINEHIKKQDYSQLYLLYGEEEYLKRQYKERLRNAICGDDTMNYSYFEGDKINVDEIIDVGNTMPFFAEHRLIIVENSSFFKTSQDKLASFLAELPDYLIIVFVEKEIDKRNKIYKAVTASGYVSEMSHQNDATLQRWIAGILKNENKVIDKRAIDLLLSKTGADMDNISAELEKLVCYCMDKDVIEEKDVEDICTTQIVSRIFDLLTAIATKKQKQALDLYYDMLTLKESPMMIMYMMVRQFNGILQVKELLSKGNSNSEIAKKMGVAPFIVGKYATQAKYFDTEQIKEALVSCAEAEERFKTGRLDDKLAVELIIIKYSTK